MPAGSTAASTILISHRSALILWLANAAWLSRNTQPASGLDIARTAFPSGSASSVQAASKKLTDLRLLHDPPLDILVAQEDARHHLASAHVHICTELPLLPQGSFFWICPGLYIASPALATCQVARRLSTIGLISLISCLLGTYTTTELTWTGTMERPALITPEHLASLVTWQPQTHRAGRISRALKQSFRDCRSPAEVKLAMTLYLPSMLGGQNVRRGRINQRVMLDEKAQAMFHRPYVIYDLGWEETRHVLEYNGRASHQAVEEDARRVAALQAMGYRVTTIYQKQLESTGFMSGLASELKRELGQTIHPVTPATDQRRFELANKLRGAGEPWTHELLGRDSVITKEYGADGRLDSLVSGR